MLNLVDEKVTHKIFGEGIIIIQNNEYIWIKFKDKTAFFRFPDIFENGIIIAEDSTLQQAILQMIVSLKTNPAENNNRKYFYVFQNKTFYTEYNGGFIWAPVKNKDGKAFFFWDNLTKVRPGDLIFHGMNGAIVAISVAKNKYYNKVYPFKDTSEDHWDLWYHNGRSVDCDYTILDYPILTCTLKKEIIEYRSEKYSAFNKNGTGN